MLPITRHQEKMPPDKILSEFLSSVGIYEQVRYDSQCAVSWNGNPNPLRKKNFALEVKYTYKKYI